MVLMDAFLMSRLFILFRGHLPRPVVLFLHATL